MRLSGDGTSFTAAEPYATTRAWTLPPGDGAKTVWVQYKDTVGNWSAAISDSIVLDTAAAPPPPPSPYPYPLALAAGKRYIVDQNNQPFFIDGEAAWSLIANLRDEDVDLYLAD